MSENPTPTHQSSRKRGRPKKAAGTKRVLSPAARERIAAAQRKRWAAAKKAAKKRAGNYVQRAIKVGAKAYVSKSASADALLSSLRAVLKGESFLTASKLQSVPTTQGTSPDGAHESLTVRQCEVLRLIARGYTATDIAKELKISVRTAEFHRAAIIQRLNLHSTAKLTRYALANSLG